MVSTRPGGRHAVNSIDRAVDRIRPECIVGDFSCRSQHRTGESSRLLSIRRLSAQLYRETGRRAQAPSSCPRGCARSSSSRHAHEPRRPGQSRRKALRISVFKHSWPRACCDRGYGAEANRTAQSESTYRARRLGRGPVPKGPVRHLYCVSVDVILGRHACSPFQWAARTDRCRRHRARRSRRATSFAIPTSKTHANGPI